METLIKGIPAFIFILGAAVVLHEFGHFIVAKLLGIRVETFSVGFGPRIFGRRYGTTDYRLSLVPLGGYVKLGGDESNAAVEGESSSDIPERERFDLRPRWHKFLVIIAGPVMNILTALAVVFAGALISGVPAHLSSLVVGRIRDGGAAERAGLRVGDRIVSFNGKDSPSWERVRNDALIAPEQPLPLVVERDGQRVELTLSPSKHVEEGEAMGELDFRPDYGNQPVRITEVLENSPAAQAGLQAGDRLISINGEEIHSEQQVIDVIQANKSAPLRLTIERAGERREMTADLSRATDGKLGIYYGAEEVLQRAGIATAASYAVWRNVEILRLTGNALGQVFSGQRSARDTFAGPIGIGRAASTAANRGGWDGVFKMLGFLSLNLGVMNLLPIPVLDGGAIALLFIEALLGVVGLTLSMKLRERIQQFGFVMLVLLMGFVIFNDLTKEASRWRGSGESPPAAASPSPQR
ncbi:MAG: RIP metalloprotease RseP [Pyrinomonadaceae bacterium]|nr:RIP metalloprotease RseP [Pyrinomonadaceae bacterium]